MRWPRSRGNSAVVAAAAGTVELDFFSNWKNGTDELDGGKWIREGNNDSLARRPLSETGIPSPPGLTHGLRVTHHVTPSTDWLAKGDICPQLSVGQTLYGRAFFLNTISDATDGGTGYAAAHPFETNGPGAGGLGGDFMAMHYGSFPDGTFPFLLAFGANNAFIQQGWCPGANVSAVQHGGRNYDPATLLKVKWYRFEWAWTRLSSANHYLVRFRIYDGITGELLFDESTMFAWTGNTSQFMSASGSNGATDLVVGDDRIVDVRIGINGGFGTASETEYTWWTGVAYGRSGWIGPYGNGIGEN